jgi:L-lactate utilization protein LutB
MTFEKFWEKEKFYKQTEKTLAQSAWNEARRTDPVKKELLEALKAVLLQPLPKVEVYGKVYIAPVDVRFHEYIKEVIAKAEGKEEPPPRRIAIT